MAVSVAGIAVVDMVLVEGSTDSVAASVVLAIVVVVETVDMGQVVVASCIPLLQHSNALSVLCVYVVERNP